MSTEFDLSPMKTASPFPLTGIRTSGYVDLVSNTESRELYTAMSSLNMRIMGVVTISLPNKILLPCMNSADVFSTSFTELNVHTRKGIKHLDFAIWSANTL